MASTLLILSLSRYWHTLRYLRPVQFYGRIWFRLYRPRPQLESAPPLRAAAGQWVAPARRMPSLLGRGEFTFLNVPGALPQVGWDGPQREKLWRYNQHYFDDLNAFDAGARAHWHAELLTGWLAANPPGAGNGWEPYPLSLRIVNWVKWALSGNALPAACIHSLAVQARWLQKRLEFHLLGNHLFSNAKALVFAGLFFQGKEAHGWLASGLRILEREVPEQILADGGHFERSTMYHALALEDLLDLCNLLRCYGDAVGDAGLVLERLRNRAAEMLDWLNAMRHPDGEIAFFNDAAFGVSPSCAELVSYAGRLGISISSGAVQSRWLEASGYARLALPDAVALLDMAAIGPDYLPGHAHADTLSFELSIHGQRLLVNSGTSCYGLGAERLRQRGTAAHNTVVVDGTDSSEVWGGFRVARRARPMSPQVSFNADSLSAECAHDGYRRLVGRPAHKRRWLMAGGCFQVEDEVNGGHLPADARYHFHPDVVVKPALDARLGEAVLPGGKIVRWAAICDSARVEPASWHPRFGEQLANQCLVLKLAAGRCSITWSWGD